ncbi:restriction endonuclease subunit S [Halobaculum rubrum]|uniref:restriction endonuclease subunit S n=1 Tax=Halobaculum rubrum TaxID=2872158 RepID=UPI001CA3CEB9|nr:restriction endonuclease subunit S [Halobaculum rubrum]QZX99389.1 restriction endonuclease subunit S [Halobaculum rubrum]
MSEEATLDEFAEPAHSGDSQERQETPIGELPTNWGVEWLKDVVKINPDGFSEDDWPSEMFEYISLSEASDGEIEESQTTPVEDAPSRAQRTVQEGDILVGTVRPKQRSHGFVSEEHAEKICSSGFGVLRPGTRLNSRYLLQEVLSNRFFSQMEAYVAGSGYPAVKISDLKKHRVAIPPLPEQRKITTVLYTIDRAIEKTEELVNQTERVKTGLTQDLLKRGINNQQMVETDSRFGSLPETWELRPLKEVSEIAGRTAPEKDDTECWGGDIPWATPSEITSLVGQTIDDTEEQLTELALDKVSSNLLPPMSVLMTTRATIGECAVNTVEMTTNQGFKNIIPGKRLDTWYTYYRLDYEKDYLASLSKGSTFPEVGKDTVENFVIPIPPLEEQRKIGEKLRSVDEQILSYKENKSQYERLKRGLMQDLLSGTVRTTDTNIEVPEEIAQYG